MSLVLLKNKTVFVGHIEFSLKLWVMGEPKRLESLSHHDCHLGAISRMKKLKMSDISEESLGTEFSMFYSCCTADTQFWFMFILRLSPTCSSPLCCLHLRFTFNSCFFL